MGAPPSGSNEGTKGFSGADLKALCTDAALGPIRQLGIRALEINANDVPPISYRHFRHAEMFFSGCLLNDVV